MLPQSAVGGLKQELAYESRVYFYRIQSLNLWVPYSSGDGGPLAAKLRTMIADAVDSAKRFRQNGPMEQDGEI